MARNVGTKDVRHSGPSQSWWIENTGVTPAPGVPFPAEAFPRYTRATYRRYWNDAAKRDEGARKPWEPWFKSRDEYLSARRESRRWSKEHSQQPMSRWSDSFGPERTKAYWSAYPNDLWRGWPITGKRRGSPWHKHYVVDVGGFMTPDEYDAAYPPVM